MKVKLEENNNIVFIAETKEDNETLEKMWVIRHHLFVCKYLGVRRKKQIAILTPSVQKFKLKGL